MAKAPAFQFYASDWLVGTVMMTPAQKGGYIDLLAYEWEHGDIPKEMMVKLSGLTGKDLEVVMKKFILVDDMVYLNRKLEETRLRQKTFSALQSERGKKGGRPKAGAKPDETRNETREGEPFLEGEDCNLKSENSFEKSEKLLTDDDQLKKYDEWGELILDGRDQGFEVELYNSGVDVSQITQDRMIKYIGLLNTYPKKRPGSQQQFRKSVLAFIVTEIQDQKKNGNRSSGSKTKQQLISDHNTDQLKRVLDGTL